MNLLSGVALGLGGLCLGVLLWADLRDQPRIGALAKTLCSAGFLLLAASLGIDTAAQKLIFVGLVLSALGDVLLLGRKDAFFLAGLVAFLLAHVAYFLAFASEGSFSLGWLVGVGLVSSAFIRWLWPHLAGWRLPVLAYCLVISLMLWSALGVPRWPIWLGALLFYASDTLVARGRFVRQDAWNSIVGLPLYYAGQYLLAGSIGF